MSAVVLILLVFGFVLFVCAGLGVPSSKYSLIAFGLACWILTSILLAVPGLAS